MKSKKSSSAKKLRILVLNYEFPPLGGGASPVSYELSKGYIQQGHHVSVVTMGYKDLPSYEVIDGIHTYRVPCWRSKKEICHPWEQLSYLISAKRFLRKHLLEKKYDVCHCHFIIPTGALALWVKNKYRIPYIITPHGSDVPGFNTDRFQLLHKFTPYFLRKICDGSSVIVSPSNYLKELIRKNISNYSDSKLIKIPNGIDTTKFKPLKKKKIILSTGRLVPRKGFQHLIKAVSDNDIGYEVHIAGDGPMMVELRQLASRSKTKIVFHGWMNNRSLEYLTLLGSASIFSLLSEKENASVSLLEAMSSGCAILVLKQDGSLETLNGAGEAVLSYDILELKSKLKRLIITSSQKQHLARKIALANYSNHDIVIRYLEVLNV